MADTFAFQASKRHSALASYYKLPPDIYYPLTNGFLQDQRYAEWSSGHRTWQLHCYGAPGCGKTSFAAIAVDDLRSRYSGKLVPIISIFIQQDVVHDHASFVEAFLAIIYDQLCGDMVSGKNHTARATSKYEEACRSGKAVSERIKLLRSALHNQLCFNEHNFLILDDYDRLDIAAQMIMDYELRDAHLHNLSVLVTRRLPLYHEPTTIVFRCDHCGKGDLDLFWACSRCPVLPGFALCYPCQRLGIQCSQQDHDRSLKEPYDHLDMDVSTPRDWDRSDETLDNSSPLYRFIVHELEGKQEDLKIEEDPAGSDPSASTNPATHKHNEGTNMLSMIVEKCEGNINMAKLRLDDIHGTNSKEDAGKVTDRLPRSIIAFFASEIERIEQKSPAQSELGLMAIAVAAAFANEQGISAEALEQCIREARMRSPHLSKMTPRSLEDVLLAANGLLVMQPYTDMIRVACYCRAFENYIQDDYNASVHSMKENLGLIKPSERIAGAIDKNTRLSVRTASLPLHVEDFNVLIARRTSPMIKTLGLYRASTMPSSLIHHDERTQPSMDDSLDLDRTCTKIDEEDTQANLICSFCEDSILKSKARYGTHHDSLESLLVHAKNYCVFCFAIYQGIYASQGRYERKWPLYSWIVRSTGRTGRNRGSIAISFKPAGNERELALSELREKTFHLFPEADLGYIPAAAALGNSTDPASSGGEQLRKWIQTCDKIHHNCAKNSAGVDFVPTRLVDLRTEDPNIVRVVDTKALGIRGPYLTLSHAWGTPDFLTLRPDNKHILMGRGIHMSELRKNFQEAIRVARFIRLKYIWIDSLCIIQGKDGDFSYEGQLMHKVYRYSYCNIAIVDSADSRGGLFRERDPEHIVPAIYRSDGNANLDEGTLRVLPEDLWSSQLLGSKIYTRAWVFQERMLAPRILHFANSQIFWDCSTISASETLPGGLPHALDKHASIDRHWRGRMQSSLKTPPIGPNDDSMESFWKSSLLDYTACNLTNQKDRTVAIWSIAKIVRDVLGENYGAGLWERALEEQLAWRMRVCRQDVRMDELQVHFPSWSWASVKGEVIAQDRICSRFYLVRGHNGKDVSFGLDESSTSPTKIDVEPRLLEPKSIDMFGFMGRGIVRALDHPGRYTLEMPKYDAWTRPVSSDERSKELWEAFPDEVLSDADLYPSYSEFIILAASKVYKTSNRYEPDHSEGERLSYSGVGLLLLPHHEYKKRVSAKLKELIRQLFSQQPGTNGPLHPSGKCMADRVADMRMLIGRLSEREKHFKSWPYYRRIGVVYFRNVSVVTWKTITGEGRKKIWLV